MASELAAKWYKTDELYQLIQVIICDLNINNFKQSIDKTIKNCDETVSQIVANMALLSIINIIGSKQYLCYLFAHTTN
jgi:ABC-type uncharacterized transport system fused permease/ATPase subunit